MNSSTREQYFELKEEGFDLWFRQNPEAAFIPARVIHLHPLAFDFNHLSILHKHKKKELAYLKSLDDAPAQYQNLIKRALMASYYMPSMSAIYSIKIRLGNYYLEVETDSGRRRFVIHSPFKNLIWITKTQCVMIDSEGNYYKIDDTRTLDSHSQDIIERSF